MLEQATQRIIFAGEELVLLAERAVLWPKHRILMLADVHFGKSATFRASGIPVPEGECQADLDRITKLVKAHEVSHLIIIGDFYHSGIPLTDSLESMLRSFRDNLQAQITLVRGNHDSHRHRLLPMEERIRLAPFEIVHDPAHRTADGCAIAGHLHPLCRIGRGSKSRLPCFVITESLLVLPAFGSFTSGHVIASAPGQSLYPIANHAVYPMPAPPTF
jgi:uncharacterized protein